MRNNLYVYEQNLVCIFVVLTQYIYCYSLLLSLLFNKSLRFGTVQTFYTFSVTRSFISIMITRDRDRENHVHAEH
jgi:hypothetical protein